MLVMDDPQHKARLDSQDMYAEIRALPAQLRQGWAEGQHLPLPSNGRLQAVVLAGMGGSAIAGDLLVGYAQERLAVPVLVWRNYDLPGWAQGEGVLVVASSHSGNTEETLSAARAAHARGCRWLALTTGGRLAELAQQHAAPLWKFVHHGQPRAAVGLTFALLLALFARLGLLNDPEDELRATAQLLEERQDAFAFETPTPQNPAKRLAERLHQRRVTVFGAQFLAPVARRWKGQINELAKAWAQFDALPEADHNTLAGLRQPASLRQDALALFLDAQALHPRNRLRVTHTQAIFAAEGIAAEVLLASGPHALAQQWSLLQWGDYAAYYLALAYGVDPTPIPTIARLKQELRAAAR